MQRNSDSKRTIHLDCRNRQISSLVGQKELSGAHDPRHALQRNGGLAHQWYMDDGDIVCHTTLVLLFLQDFDVAHDRVRARSRLPRGRPGRSTA